MRRTIPVAIVIGIFCVTFALQSYFTREVGFLDENYWTNAVITFSELHLLQPSDPAYGYPGTTMLVPAGAAVYFGADPWAAMKISYVAIYAFFTALVAFLLYRLSPKTLWCLGGSVFLMAQPFFMEGTGPSALVLPMIVSMVLLTQYLTKRPSQEAVLALGVVSGFALATRLDVSSVFCFCIALRLFFNERRFAWMYLVAALATFILLDPFMWSPLQYAADTYAKIHTHYFNRAAAPSLLALSQQFAIPIFSILFAGAMLLFAPEILPMPRDFLLWLIATTLFLLILLLLSQYHPNWYFFPPAIVWEVFAPIFCFALLDPRAVRKPRWLSRPLARNLFSLVLPLCQVVMIFL